MPASRANIAWVLGLLLAAAAGGQALAEDVTLLRAREGAAALMRGQYDKAIASYDEALQTPEIADFIEASIYSDRGVAKWRLNQTKQAIDDFNKSIQLSPENGTVYNNRGNALMDLGQPDEAVKDFDRAIALSPNYGPAYNNRGNARVALGQSNLAFQDFRKAVELMPQSAVPFNGRGTAHEQLKRYHAAVRDLTRAITLNPKYSAAYRHRAEAYLELGMYREAVADATQVFTLEPDLVDPDLLLLRARANAGDKKFNPALDDLNKVIELKPDLADAYIERGMVFTQARRFDDAIGDFNRAIELDPKSIKAYAMRATAKLQADSKDDALYDANQALQINSNDALALRVRANVYEALERPDDAITDYRNALAQDPFQTESREALQRLAPGGAGGAGPHFGRAGRRLGDQGGAAWTLHRQQPTNIPRVQAELEMFGSGEPKILEWKLLKDALSGIGLLKYYAGDFGDGEDSSLEYVAIIDTRANKVVSIEPQQLGFCRRPMELAGRVRGRDRSRRQRQRDPAPQGQAASGAAE